MKQNDISDSKSVLGTKSVRFSTRFEYIIFPLNPQLLMRSLMNNGYQPPPNYPPIDLPPEIKLAGSGILGLKKDFIVDVNTDKQFVGVRGNDPNTLKTEFLNLLAILEENKLSKDKITFYETQAHYYYEPENKVIDKLNESFKKTELIDKATKKFDKDMNIFSVRLFEKGNFPEGSDFFEINLIPDISFPNEIVNIAIVYRNHKLKEFEKFISNYEEQLEDYLKSIFT